MPLLAPSTDAPLVALATGEELAAFRQPAETPLDKAAVAVAIASGIVRAYCGWRIDFARESFTVDGNPTRLLVVPTLRLTDVSAVTVDGVALVDGTDFTWSGSGLLWTTSAWTGPARSVVVDVEHGYDPVPDEVRGVVLAVAARSLVSPSGETRLSTGPFSVAYGATGAAFSLLDSEKDALNPYRLEQA